MGTFWARTSIKSLPVIRHKNIFCAQSQARILNGFGTGRLREESQGLLLSFLTFLRPIFFLARLAFFPPPLTAPGSPRMISDKTRRGCRPSSLRVFLLRAPSSTDVPVLLLNHSNVRGQISEHIFAPNEGYCLYVNRLDTS